MLLMLSSELYSQEGRQGFIIGVRINRINGGGNNTDVTYHKFPYCTLSRLGEARYHFFVVARPPFGRMMMNMTLNDAKEADKCKIPWLPFTCFLAGLMVYVPDMDGYVWGEREFWTVVGSDIKFGLCKSVHEQAAEAHEKRGGRERPTFTFPLTSAVDSAVPPASSSSEAVTETDYEAVTETDYE